MSKVNGFNNEVNKIELKEDSFYEDMLKRAEDKPQLMRHGGLQVYLEEKYEALRKVQDKEEKIEIKETEVVKNGDKEEQQISKEGKLIDNNFRNHKLNLAKLGSSEVILDNENYYNSESIAVGPRGATGIAIGTMTTTMIFGLIGGAFGPIGAATGAFSFGILSSGLLTPQLLHDCLRFQYDLVKSKVFNQYNNDYIIENLSDQKLLSMSDPVIKKRYIEIKELSKGNAGLNALDLESSHCDENQEEVTNVGDHIEIADLN